MQEILTRALCFVAIIILGYVLKKIGFFHEDDFHVLSKIVIKITLPAAIVTSFAGKEIDPSMLLLSAFALGAGILYIAIAFVFNRKRGREQQSFEMINTAGYNIGNFTLPFVQSFLGPVGVITTSIFDMGNACICLGGSYGAASVVKEGGKFSVMRIIKALSKSVAFDCYVLMVIMNFLHISMPSVVIDFAQIIANGNAFMAMLMIGVGFKLSGDMSKKGAIVRILFIRYAVAAVLAIVSYFILPFELEVRQAVVLLVFSPIASAAPAFTNELKGDVGLSSAVNSISIVCSILIIVALLLIML